MEDKIKTIREYIKEKHLERFIDVEIVHDNILGDKIAMISIFNNGRIRDRYVSCLEEAKIYVDTKNIIIKH